jgi:hypothetical protein
MEEDSPDAPLKPPGEPGGPAPVPAPEFPQPRVVKARRWNRLAGLAGAFRGGRDRRLDAGALDLPHRPARRDPVQVGDGVEAGKTRSATRSRDRQGRPVALRDDRQSVGVVVQLDRTGGELRGRGHRVLGRAAAHRHRVA